MIQKNLMRFIAIVAVFSAGIYTADVIQQPIEVHASTTQIDGYTYSADVVEVLNEINKYRKAVGLEPYKINPLLSKSAESHAKYVVMNYFEGPGHSENPDRTGYTGSHFGARAEAAGYIINEGTEILVVGHDMRRNNRENVADLLAGVYHRGPILSSSYDTVGIGVYGDTLNSLVLVVDNSDLTNNEKAIAYPYEGQTDVPTLFNLREHPDPLKKYGVSSSGYLISYKPEGEVGHSGGHTMTLKDSKGNLVPLHNKNNEPDESSGNLFIIPKSELKKGEKYTVDISYLDSDDVRHNYSWSFTTAGTKVQTTTPPENNYPEYTKRFADFDGKQWWAEDMIWAVDKGIISGYGNIWNQKTKKYETYLKPNNPLTEAHFLMILFRFAEPKTYGAMKPETEWLYNVPYRLANALDLPTLANESSEAKKKLAEQGITRGKLAQLLISYHKGERVTESHAINFMIQEGLTVAKTVEGYNADQILTRAQVSAFLQRYEKYALSQM